MDSKKETNFKLDTIVKINSMLMRPIPIRCYKQTDNAQQTNLFKLPKEYIHTYVTHSQKLTILLNTA